jgi:hypothetical protein
MLALLQVPTAQSTQEAVAAAHYNQVAIQATVVQAAVDLALVLIELVFQVLLTQVAVVVAQAIARVFLALEDLVLLLYVILRIQ